MESFDDISATFQVATDGLEEIFLCISIPTHRN